MPDEKKPRPAKKTVQAKKPAAKKAAAKSVAKKKPVAKKAATKKVAAKPTSTPNPEPPKATPPPLKETPAPSPSPKKTMAKKAATKKKPAAKKAPAKKVPTKKVAAKKPQAKKAVAKKTSAKKKTTGAKRKAVGAVKKVTPKKLRKQAGKKIMFVSAECAPFAKVGGLADAVAGLAKAVARRGHDVRVVLPLYSSIDYEKYDLQLKAQACVHMGSGEENWIAVHEGMLDGQVTVWFVDHGRYFQRPGIYDEGPEYQDNAYRYGLLSKAALQIAKDFDFIPDVMHLHDWASAPVAAFLKTWDRVDSPLSATASVLTIHNIGHQGKYHAGVMDYYGLGGEHFTSDKFEDFGMVNMLKGGVHFADAITTVSPTHARELLEPMGGHGLAHVLADRASDLSGILNGVDTDHWDPDTDPFIPASYDAENLAGKAICKRALQERFGLPVDPSVPIFGVISRFAHQKGLHLLFNGLHQLVKEGGMQFIALGSGEPEVENFFNWLRAEHSDQVGVYIGYHNELAHLIEAGSDFFVMPSLYEPCGLNQIYSLRYGTIPVVRATGGLDDTVEAFDGAQMTGTGFKFHLPNGWELEHILRYARDVWWHQPEAIKTLRANGMQQSFPWDEAAHAYEEVYTKAQANRAAAA